jgi:hypothetical protein
VLLLEPSSVVNTGDAGGELTAEVETLARPGAAPGQMFDSSGGASTGAGAGGSPAGAWGPACGAAWSRV